MLHTLLANASDLDHWASLLEGKSTFPELLRRLIRATTPTLTSLSFPSAEGVQLEGWDGLTTADAATPYVPAGPTGWELGTNKDQKGKADDDYDTRTANPLGLVPADSTFVFCTPRRWGQRKKWTTARLKEGHWRDVRATMPMTSLPGSRRPPPRTSGFPGFCTSSPTACRTWKTGGSIGPIKRPPSCSLIGWWPAAPRPKPG